ncbi:nucleoside-diphosphate-sugar epimerase [Kribbella orskensis]|uniref:Nucleoside-diphosphate-sugar epimerase n=1 Tax=Kribbella orskensis TaxID=2512216 RepID=A0ABY2BQV3_9ACTN|nr:MULTISPECIES: NAD-dependent epimerase/dehydratase family protein [Kribbella]TCN37222.1 nucleoside-diphosphate-sugar epimerase [Kribbella sp. VKM Ac-2500]TCO27870.1 nucleoside-diphosphate-sugar epimerase [Kribbella orskensis]
MKVFLTGGSGYIGRATIESLRRHGHEVTALARSDRAVETVTALGAKAVVGDLTDLDVLRAGASAADGVIHLGAVNSPEAATIDLAAAEAMLDGLGGRGPYVHTGGVWVYGDTDGLIDESAPTNPPAITAWRLDNEARVLASAAAGSRPIVVMPGLVYGRSNGLIEASFVEPARTAGAVRVIGDGANHTTLVHVDDIADLYVLALEAPAGAVYLGVAQNLRFADLAPALAQAAGHAGKRVDQISLEQALEQMGPVADAYALDQQISGDRARRELGWNPAHLDAAADLAAGR